MLCYLLPTTQYFLFAEGLPALLYYSHIPSIVISLLIGIFVFSNNPRALPNILLLGISLCFSLWAFFNLILWTNTNSDLVIFLWSLFGILGSLLSILTIYFVYAFVTKKDVGLWHKLTFAVLLLPAIVLTPTNYNLSGFNLELCGSSGFEGFEFVTYYTALGILAMIWIAIVLIMNYARAKEILRKEIIWIGVGVEFFLLAFFTTSFMASYLNDLGLVTNYSLEQYGLFGMTFFMAAIALIIVRFRAFNIGLIASQALVIALVILISSQFTFADTVTNKILIGITLALTGGIGLLLIRSVNAEIRQRKHIEHLAQELEKSNKQQVILLHFITHQIKGYVTKSRNIFASLIDGTYGPVTETMKPLLEEGLRSDTKGAETIQDILNAANIQSGKVTYTKAPLNVKELVESIAGDLKANADSRGLSFTVSIAEGDYAIPGDRMQLTNAFKNLIDNSIKYTQKGSVSVSLTREEAKIRFQIQDTGVGITPEDMKLLFTEGGHGKESQKVNVESTGFGLYIVKNIVEAHQGKVWAESEGKDKGSRFIVELPTN